MQLSAKFQKTRSMPSIAGVSSNNFCTTYQLATKTFNNKCAITSRNGKRMGGPAPLQSLMFCLNFSVILHSLSNSNTKSKKILGSTFYTAIPLYSRRPFPTDNLRTWVLCKDCNNSHMTMASTVKLQLLRLYFCSMIYWLKMQGYDYVTLNQWLAIYKYHVQLKVD